MSTMLWSPIKVIAQQFNSKLKFQQSFMPDFTGTKLHTRPQLWLLSDVHKDNGWKFPVIFDEAQFVKNIESTTHKACLQIPWHCSVMLSGTTLDNKGTDIRGLIHFLSGHNFQGKNFYIDFWQQRQEWKD